MTLTMVGAGLGTVTMGYASDRLGRYPVALTATLGLIISNQMGVIGQR